MKKNCPSKKIVSFVKLDPCYALTKTSNGVCEKLVSAPIFGPRKKAIWVPKALVPNIQGPK